MKKILPSAIKEAISLKKANKSKGSSKKSKPTIGIASSLVPIVPLSPPSGRVMYMDYVYNDAPKREPDHIEEVINQIRVEIGLEIPKEDNPEDEWSLTRMTSIPVTGKTRKIKATWDPSLLDDLKSLHSIDVEAELAKILAEEMQKEVIKNFKKLSKKKSR